MFDVDYVVLVDEAGDPGITRLSAFDESGGSNWFCLSCVILRGNRAEALLQDLEGVRRAIKSYQSKRIHYRNLAPYKKLHVTSFLGRAPVRIISVISHKLNMHRYRNHRAEAVSLSRGWFYWWMMRLMLERVSKFISMQCRSDNISRPKCEILISKRGGMNYHELKNYLAKLWIQGKGRNLFLNKGNIDWEYFDIDWCRVVKDDDFPILQLSDIAASSFYEAVDSTSDNFDATEGACNLMSRLCRDNKALPNNFGFKLMPDTIKASQISHNHIRFFEKMGRSII